ncbi:hypothetical protein QF000_005394 [Paraburkholderia atlantica]|uniref:Helix-turn-helix domain-containing protein n=1 Tax=Paraburkholderia atlantica TaxID=2654982 RepID=A0A7W8Q9F4_PARAM|nr:helix-turn-helix domain-containing protein [Paraburkholderia atlantica]MBB5426170.1 hypothetical protein [Paraburkholderia atlantica]
MKTLVNRAPDALPSSVAQLGAMTIAQFCEIYHVSRVGLYKLRRHGLGPAELQLGRKVLITYAAAREWEARMTKRHTEAQAA